MAFRTRSAITALVSVAIIALPLLAPGSAEARRRWPSPSPTPTKTTTPAPPPKVTCAGSAPVKADGSAWKCTFDDEFDGSSLNTSKWAVTETATSGYHSGSECFVNSSSNVSVGSGYVSLTARKQAKPFVCSNPTAGDYTTQYTSGSIMTYGKFSQTYGRFAIRAAFPASTVAGLQSALWLYPNDSRAYGYSGELDIAEEYSQYPDRAIPYVHYPQAGYDPNTTNNYCLINDVSAFHEYVMEWTSTSVTISYDGNTCITDKWTPVSPLRAPQPFDQPFFVNLTQALGIGGNLFNPSKTPLPATTKVDYVRVWS